mmetsp:Transcript_29054/g.84842  ORF Transcript_29054/g.84842 Transcript_29054/m.84842 type:complete len:235 (-) Transcript_29054:367-1071(-)
MKEESEIFLGQLGKGGVFGIDSSLEDELFLLLELVHFLLDGVFCDETCCVDRFALANAIGSVHRLHFYGRVPPRLEQKHIIRLLQVQSFAASFEAHQDDLDLGFGLEGGEDAPPLGQGHVSEQFHNLETTLLEAPLYKVDHGAVLREHNGLPRGIFGDHFVDGLGEGLDLAAGLPLAHVEFLEDGVASDGEGSGGLGTVLLGFDDAFDALAAEWALLGGQFRGALHAEDDVAAG